MHYDLQFLNIKLLTISFAVVGKSISWISIIVNLLIFKEAETTASVSEVEIFGLE